MANFLQAVRALFAAPAPRKPYRTRLALTSLGDRIVPDAGPIDPPEGDEPPGDEAPPPASEGPPAGEAPPPAGDAPPAGGDPEGWVDTLAKLDPPTRQEPPEIVAARERFNEAALELRELDRALERVAIERNALKAALENAKALLADAEKDLRNYGDQLKSKQNALANFDAENPTYPPGAQSEIRDAIVAAIAVLEPKVDFARNTAIAMTNEIERLQPLIDELNSEIDSLMCQIDGKLAELANLRKIVEDWNREQVDPDENGPVDMMEE